MMTMNVTPSFTSNKTIRLQYQVHETDDRVFAEPVIGKSYQRKGLCLWEINGEVTGTNISRDEFGAIRIGDVAQIFEPDRARKNAKGAAYPMDAWSVKVNGEPIRLTGVRQSDHITNTVETGWFFFDFDATRTVYLDLAEPIETGARIEISGPGTSNVIETIFVPAKTICREIQIPPKGFQANDTKKIAYIDRWSGWDFDPCNETSCLEIYDIGTPFRVVNVQTGDTVLEGQIKRASVSERAESGASNPDLFSMEFSKVTETGTYFVEVQGVGISPNFDIGKDPWAMAKEFTSERYRQSLIQKYRGDWNACCVVAQKGATEMAPRAKQIVSSPTGYNFETPNLISMFEVPHAKVEVPIPDKEPIDLAPGAVATSKSAPNPAMQNEIETALPPISGAGADAFVFGREGSVGQIRDRMMNYESSGLVKYLRSDTGDADEFGALILDTPTDDPDFPNGARVFIVDGGIINLQTIVHDIYTV